MAIVLGIDTGGTYTDSVIIDLAEAKVIAKAKASTTYKDLTVGISNSISSLPFDSYDEVKLVSLSTTLATNAVVEGRGCEVGLIMIGEQPIGKIPVKHYAVAAGGHDIRGNAREELDLMEVARILDEFNGRVDAIAISGFASVRNPEHELAVSELVKKKVNIPVVCGHQLTTSLGFYERTLTAVLNARLIPIITNLISSVKKVLLEREIRAPLMIVKGDGNLMSEELAVEKPIDTLLSGPAASIIGATALTDRQEALVLDMGGTTTDIAILKNGVPRIDPEGARVGGWLTRVEAAAIDTCGLGGDSYLRINKHRKLLIGPEKACPLSFAGAKSPYLQAEYEEQYNNLSKLRITDVLDGFMLLRKYDEKHLSETQKRVAAYLESGPHTLLNIATAIDKNPFSLDIEPMVKSGIITRVALTPTDILHASGVFEEWNREIALSGVEILARLMKKTFTETLNITYNSIVDSLCLAILKAALIFEQAKPEVVNNLEANNLINKFISPNNDDITGVAINLRIPVIGIGAPVAAYLPAVAGKLKSELIIPQHSDVANAIGAATGKVMEKIKITIDSSAEGFILYSQWERKSFVNLEDAKQHAVGLAEKQAGLLAEKAGAANYKITTSCKDVYANEGYGPHIQSIIETNVIGRPGW